MAVCCINQVGCIILFISVLHISLYVYYYIILFEAYNVFFYLCCSVVQVVKYNAMRIEKIKETRRNYNRKNTFLTILATKTIMA